MGQNFQSSDDRILNYLTANADSFAEIRRDLHQHPELAFKEKRTSELVADYLSDYGYSVEKGIAKTGLVASLKRGNSDRIIGIRADMDALPMQEETGLSYESQNAGVMHACGHDGHTTIALAAAKALKEEGEFSGTARFIFQPAEEIGFGAKAMIDEGLFDRFPVDTIFGLHNWPGLATGKMAFVSGPAMASVDFCTVVIRGKGSHGAEPQNGIDPVTIAAYLITSLQTIVSRNVSPQEMAVVTVGAIQGGHAGNVIPEEVVLRLTVRAYQETVREAMLQRLHCLIHSITEGFGGTATISSQAGFAAVVNEDRATLFAEKTAVEIFGNSIVEQDFEPRTASEDFAFMLQKQGGAFLFLGNGESAGLHSAKYDFNDAIITPGARYWAGLVERYLHPSRVKEISHLVSQQEAQ